ncbi:hypothetical protein AJ79_07681 [Helicocarpus griseus UAMH5409]|uniref:Alpha/beta hydrolase fold-3 domain-containing protein n=1 Tax=Helicocarpus griseus UAMH5409 TaxID=1447875 RepID=A0A2B7X0H7_9EURO|nr:hypothetical protein AJ79_07681 [Helicocarpus griseus UAMH5409]
MPFNALTVGTAVTPTVLATWLSHYANRKAHRKKPTAHISYHEGLEIVRRFLYYSSHHSLEDLQRFTSQWVPCPSWINIVSTTVPEKYITTAADLLVIQLGPEGLSRVGGTKWWQWRGNKPALQGEWIETERDVQARRRVGVRSNRIMLYLHGGAYFFGSLNSHRYQIQRHARKLKARVFARAHYELFGKAAYRLAPQFPFPCGLHDCLAAYLYILGIYKPSEIIIAGDSAGAGMAVSILVTLRDQRIPLPSGAILISPWVDLMHSFPSVAGEGEGDYVPPYGFMHRPSMAWPPPNSDEMDAIAKAGEAARAQGMLPESTPFPSRAEEVQAAVRGFSIRLPSPNSMLDSSRRDSTRRRSSIIRRQSYTSSKSDLDIFPNQSPNLEIEIEGTVVEIKDQIHMYTTNDLLSHPLVSPVLQPSLGGLPPMLVVSGGAELLCDEQIYLAHKAADPMTFLPSEEILNLHDPQRQTINKYPPTFVQLQVWDDLCHVTPTLSFTKPAKYMFRSIAQFGAWALARAQQSVIDIPYQVSEISSSDVDGPQATTRRHSTPSPFSGFTKIGKAGDPLPPFTDHMIRQRVDRHGNIFPLAGRAYLPALQLLPDEIGVPKPEVVRKWLGAKVEWDTKYAKEKMAVQQQRVEELLQGIGVFRHGEYPPPCSLASRKDVSNIYDEKAHKRNYGMWLWSLVASMYDSKTLGKEKGAGTTDTNGGPAQPSWLIPPKKISRTAKLRKKLVPQVKRTRPSRHHQAVTDLGQATESIPVLAPPPRSRYRDQPQIKVSGPDGMYGEQQPSMAPPDQHEPGFATGPRFMNHFGEAGRRSSSEYTDDVSAMAVRHADGVISPHTRIARTPTARSEAEADFKTSVERRTPTVPPAAPVSPVISTQDDVQQDGIDRQLDDESTAVPSQAAAAPVVDGQLSPKASVGADGDANVNTAGVQLFGKKMRKPKYDFDSLDQNPSDTEPFPEYSSSSVHVENV